MGHPRNRAERRFQRDRIVRNRMATIAWREDINQWDVWTEKMLSNKVRNRAAGAKGYWYEHPGMFHKKKPYDCGKARCVLCHRDRVFYPKRHRLETKQKLREELDDLGL